MREGQVSLVRKLDVLIAGRLGLKPEDVTTDLIRRRRAGRKPRLDNANPYGGRVSDGLRHLTEEEVASALRTFRRMADEAHAEPVNE